MTFLATRAIPIAIPPHGQTAGGHPSPRSRRLFSWHGFDVESPRLWGEISWPTCNARAPRRERDPCNFPREDFHDNSARTLEDTAAHYALFFRVVTAGFINLTAQDQRDMVAYMKLLD